MDKLINIGCGFTHHPDWTNLDVSSSDPSVLLVDINKGLPFPSGTAAVCYSSHLLEHLDKNSARQLLGECMRVLNKSGVVRIAVPDLEGITREYLRLLDAVQSGDKTKEPDYDWILLELYDQTVRNISGGEMADYLSSENLPNEQYVVQRCGMEAKASIENSRKVKSSTGSESTLTGSAWFKRIYQRLRKSGYGGHAILRLLLGNEYEALKIGRFRISGEIHQWMYDQFSLSRLLEQTGFVDIRKCTAIESRIPNFDKYSLDALNGVPRKPDSIYIEASKP